MLFIEHLTWSIEVCKDSIIENFNLSKILKHIEEID